MNRLMKKITAFIVTTILVLGAVVVAPNAASSDIAVRVSSTTCMQDDEISAEIYFPAKYQKVAALDMSMLYDSSKLEVVSITQSKDLRKARDKQSNGEVFSQSAKIAGQINWSLAGSNNYEFTGIFVTVVFKVKSLADHGACDLNLKITRAANSGLVDITNDVRVSGATFDILRNTENDLTFKLNKEGTGYVITEYLCVTYDTVVIPETHKGLPVVGIEYGAFMNHAEIKTLVLPAQLEYIGKESFYGCSGFEELVIPDYVTTIGEGAFEGCSGLKKVTLPVGLESIGKLAFGSCPFIKSIELPFTLKTLGSNAFNGCYMLNEVKISKNTEIGSDAFRDYDNNMKFITVEGNENLKKYISDSKLKATTEYVKDLSLGTVADIPEQQYTKEAITPAIELSLTSGDAVVNGTDYKIIYRKNVDIGTAKVYVVGINAYGEGYYKEFGISCKHADVTKKTVKAATCTKEGTSLVTCKLCGEKSEEIIPAKGHKTGDEWIIDVRPSIYKEGLKHKVCRVCKANTDETVMPKVIPDVNGDGRVNSSDALIVLQYAVDMENSIKTEEQKLCADTNGDGKINSYDALIILKIAVDDIKL